MAAIGPSADAEVAARTCPLGGSPAHAGHRDWLHGCGVVIHRALDGGAIAKLRGALYGKRACNEGTAVLRPLALGMRRAYLLAAAGDGQTVTTSQQPG